MRWTLSLAGLGLLFLAVACLYAERRKASQWANRTADSVHQILSSHSRASADRIEKILAKTDQEAGRILERTKKKSRGYVSAPELNEPELPKWLISAGKKIRAAGTEESPELESALADFLKGAARLGVKNVHSKTYLLVKGRSEDGEAFAAVYDPAVLFSDLDISGEVRTWLVMDDGTVAYHSQPRFLGSNAANLRPVAMGLEGLAEQRKISFMEKYQGMDGKASMGSWSTVPSLGLLVGSEWSKASAPLAFPSAFLTGAFLAAILGALALGLSLRPHGRSQSESEPLFDTKRLDQDALDYLASVKGAAEQAIAFAGEQEKVAQEAVRQRGVVAGQLRFARWKLGVLEEFQDKVLGQATGKQVWESLARLFAESTPGLVVVLYRYASSTYSLVPESLWSSYELEDHAKSYLCDARIFIGKPQFIRTLTETEAFDRWNKARQRHMPLHLTEFRAHPIELAGTPKGLVLVAFDRRMNAEGELEEAFALHEALLRRATSFCDTKERLLQFTDAKGTAGQALASASNDARGESRPT